MKRNPFDDLEKSLISHKEQSFHQQNRYFSFPHEISIRKIFEKAIIQKVILVTKILSKNFQNSKGQKATCFYLQDDNFFSKFFFLVFILVPVFRHHLEFGDVQAFVDDFGDGSDLRAQFLLDAVQCKAIVISNQIDCHAQVTESSGTTNSVQVGLGHLGEVKVDDHINGLKRIKVAIFGRDLEKVEVLT